MPYPYTLTAAVALASLVLSGCAGGGSTRPTPPPAATASPAAAGANPTAAAAANPTAAPTAPAPAGRPAQLSGAIDDLADAGWLVAGTVVMVDGSTRLTGTPERGAWAQVRGERLDDGRVRAREATVLAATAVVVGTLEAASGDRWTIRGVSVRVPAAIVPAGVAPGRTVRAVVHLDDDDGYVALLVEPARALSVTGQVSAIDPAGITVDGRRFLLAPGAALPAGLAPGVVARVDGDDDDDDGRYTLRAAAPAPGLRVVGAPCSASAGASWSGAARSSAWPPGCSWAAAWPSAGRCS